MHKKISNILLGAAIISGIVATGLFVDSKNAAAAEGEFYLQVSPSPLVVTVKPGETTSFDLKIRNAGSQPEKLKIAPRSFATDSATGEVKFDDVKKPAEIGDWTRFSATDFTVQPGEWYTQKVTFAIPKEAGFSYSFALVITRQELPKNTTGRSLKGSIAVFALVNVDKPGATRSLALDELSVDKEVYEYLPARLNVRFKNTGNSIVRPAGNIFIQRGRDDVTPLGTLRVNENEGYILPGTVRTLSTNWDDGFQVVRSTESGGVVREDLVWNWEKLSDIRIGHYTAKLVAVYNDGVRDVPVTGEVGFWVIPWKLILGFIIILGILIAGIWAIVSRFIGSPRRRKGPIKFRR